MSLAIPKLYAQLVIQLAQVSMAQGELKLNAPLQLSEVPKSLEGLQMHALLVLLTEVSISLQKHAPLVLLYAQLVVQPAQVSVTLGILVLYAPLLELSQVPKSLEGLQMHAQSLHRSVQKHNIWSTA